MPMRFNKPDSYYKLSLPLGADRDHEYCNPTVGGESSKLLEKMSSLDWKTVRLKVVGHFDDSGHRMQDFMDSAKRMALHGYVKDFVLSSTIAA
ncbi:hypothetical protein CUMW_058310 [Citrus unshiu]|nr:hypothetical protein CUMW_058310 [Citrus unshiu]